ncbi:type II toxin-antitoxin system HipA family toxin YjjJ [Desulfobulbus alkaliphilus]|uniref:type II toxin-antitoxin system HipA family toxin YjjJ n=1 Tax=Desulfobulbus alkaliphilus TaxID=869814 RepID=UPI00196598D4|nr:type II toxin-antitoxin system HipA family toxin YjjJ [Desulfobulbus alkaliphilus]MBM9535779.1 type II toxin-antitoxin system HipA family toxin YjjJ [Desulfobulbus alkaliphilus]
MPQKILEILSLGPATTRTLAAGTGMTRQTVNRKLRELGDSVVKFDKIRPPLYYAVTEAFESGSKIPLAAVDPHGNTHLWGVLRPLSHGGFYLQPTVIAPKVLRGHKETGFFEGLPFFLDDLRPQGFIGRQIARGLNAQSDIFPPDPRNWNQEHIGRYLVANGDDLPGNLKIGRMALDRVRRPPQKARREDYPELADKALEGDVHGSSAGGEQAKFATYSRERGAHVIVKFSPKGNGELATRWRDILATEFIASEVLHAYDIPAAELEIFEVQGRLFLESLRFDRIGEHGRLSMIAMQAIDSEFSGIGSGWLKVAKSLEHQKLISRQHFFDIAVYWGFGKLINNTDMHLGNVGFSIDSSGFSLAPIYDMCSMGFSPKSTGEIPPFAFSPPDIDGTLSYIKDSCPMIKGMARSFWKKTGESELVSDAFKRFLEQANPLHKI